VRDARAISDAGAFLIVVEGVVEPIAVAVTRAVACPTIGIGGSVHCDGQVLVIDDMLGMFERTARFVKRYEEFGPRIAAAAAAYASEVRARTFPTDKQTYAPK
jgi:3-methyl-2-oxobutanoate hydroxymethyltransferase